MPPQLINEDPVVYLKSCINLDFNIKKPFSLSLILGNTDRLEKRLEDHSTTMSCLSITGPDAHIHLLRLPGTAEDGLAEALIILDQGACHPDPPCVDSGPKMSSYAWRGGGLDGSSSQWAR